MNYQTVYSDDYVKCFRYADPQPDGRGTEPNVTQCAIIFYNIRGKKKLVIEGCTYEIGENELFFLSKYNAYTLSCEPGAPSECYAFHFNKYVFRFFDEELCFLQKLLEQELGEVGILHCDARQRSLFMGCLEHLDRVTDRASKRIAFISVLSMMINEINTSELSLPKLPDDEGHRILFYINAHLTEDLSVEQLAKRFFMSYSQFYRLFRRMTGMTLSNYLAYKRVIMARDLINQNVRIKDAAEQCGFRDYTTYYKCTCKFLKKPPGAERTTKNNDPHLRNGMYQIK